MRSSLEAISEACRIVGGQAALSRNLGISSPTVNQWTTGIRQIPAERCPEIEKLLVVLSPAKSFVLTLTGPI
jgi:DNA-binding transcriptional regulator YdaS (Cro superfamily)